jgi:hypothetical protein
MRDGMLRGAQRGLLVLIGVCVSSACGSSSSIGVGADASASNDLADSSISADTALSSDVSTSADTAVSSDTPAPVDTMPTSGVHDAGPDGPTIDAGGVIACPGDGAFKDGMLWPADFTASECIKSCGPDKIGQKVCHDINATAMCDGCQYPDPLPACYVPSAPPQPCPAGTTQKLACPAVQCGVICVTPDATTPNKTIGCLCTDPTNKGAPAWTCATWDPVKNTWK